MTRTRTGNTEGEVPESRLHGILDTAMRIAVLPSGALFLDTASTPDPADGLTAAARARLARAVERGAGHALLDLGATELDAPLAPTWPSCATSGAPS